MNNKSTQKMQLSVIIPCLNGADTIASQLEALALQQWSGAWEVIVSDNGSTDNSLAIAEQYKECLPNLKVVDAAAKRGASYARNAGIAAASSDTFLFCDADDEVAVGWLASLAESLDKYDFVTGSLEFKKLNEPWRVQKHQDKQQELPGTSQEPPFFPWGNGANFGCTRLVIDTIGGFDESVLFTEDVEFSWRAQQAGFALYFTPNATVHYRLRHGWIANYIQSLNWAKSGFDVRNRYGLVKGKFLKLRVLLGGCKSLLMLLVKTRTKEDWVNWMRRFGAMIGEVQGCRKYLS